MNIHNISIYNKYKHGDKSVLAGQYLLVVRSRSAHRQTRHGVHILWLLGTTLAQASRPMGTAPPQASPRAQGGTHTSYSLIPVIHHPYSII